MQEYNESDFNTEKEVDREILEGLKTDAEDRGVDPAKHDCLMELCTGCGIAYFEFADDEEQMHQYQSRTGDPICLCGTCRSNILAKEKERILEGFVERLWGALWKDHSTPNITFTSIECHIAKRELLMDVQELARQIFKDE